MRTLAATLVGAGLLILTGAAHCNPTVQVSLSELRLRSTVAATNNELRRLKRDFVEHISITYFELKSDPQISYLKAHFQGEPALVGATLMSEAFAELLTKKYAVERRLAAGLKLVFARLLPVATLQRLVKRYPSYAWLRTSSQVNLRQRFPAAKEAHLVQLYSLLELRARARAADDVVQLSEEPMRRILNVVQLLFVEKLYAASGEQQARLARHGLKMALYYLDEVVERRERIQAAYLSSMQQAAELVQLAGSEKLLLSFLDSVIDVEMLDIELANRGQRRQLPPTITNEMVLNVESRLIPSQVLVHVQKDRELLLENRNNVRLLLQMDRHKSDAELADWAASLAEYMCKLG